jgi:hypothetical protein
MVSLIATELRDYGRQHFPIATFFDSNDIAAGHDFAEGDSQANVADSADGCQFIPIRIPIARGAGRRSCPPSVMGCPVLGSGRGHRRGREALPLPG